MKTTMISLALALAGQLVDSRLARAYALLQRLDVEAGAHLCVSGDVQRREETLAGRRVENRARCLLSPRQRLGRIASGLLGIRDGRFDLGETSGQTFALGDGGFVPHRGAIDLFRVCCQRGVVVAEPLERLTGVTARVLPCALSIGECFAQ